MKTTMSDPIIAEVRKARDEQAAQFGYDIAAIFKHLQTQQQTSGRRYVRYPRRPATIIAPPKSTE